MKTLIVVSIFMIVAAESSAIAREKTKIVTTRKTQSVDFEGDTVDGTAHRPDGAYLVQKRGVDFVPLYKVREHFDENIKASVDYLK